MKTKTYHYNYNQTISEDQAKIQKTTKTSSKPPSSDSQTGTIYAGQDVNHPKAPLNSETPPTTPSSGDLSPKSDSQKVTSQEPYSPTAQDVNANNGTTPPPPNHDYPPPKKSNIVPIVIITVVLAIILAIFWAVIPKNFEDCVNFPGSSTPTVNPPSCKTFYGATFGVTDAYEDVLVEDGQDGSTIDGQDNTTTAGQLPQDLSLIGTDGVDSQTTTQTAPTPNPTILPQITTPTPDPKSTDTTKGGQPAPTPIPTSTPNTQTNQPATPPTNLTGSASVETYAPPIDWTKHQYPDQRFNIYMPSGYNPSGATRNINTNITYIHANKDSYSNNPVIQMELRPSWSGYEAIKNNSISFKISGDVGVIKDDGDANRTRYYFVQGGKVWIFTCHHHSNGDIKDTCDKILKSIRFT